MKLPDHSSRTLQRRVTCPPMPCTGGRLQMNRQGCGITTPHAATQRPAAPVWGVARFAVERAGAGANSYSIAGAARVGGKDSMRHARRAAAGFVLLIPWWIISVQ